ncbi:MAG: hypothetical protein J6J16_02180 [Lachnospiraceae bacterium]|nr:hypothetical protein [Lachnospiraceae bacterium]
MTMQYDVDELQSTYDSLVQIYKTLGSISKEVKTINSKKEGVWKSKASKEFKSKCKEFNNNLDVTVDIMEDHMIALYRTIANYKATDEDVSKYVNELSDDDIFT